MDRNNNLFAPAKAEGKKEFLEKIQQEKAKAAEFKTKFQYAQTIQKYMRGIGARLTVRKNVTTELSKNLSGLEQLSQILISQKQVTLRIPLAKVMLLLDQLAFSERLGRFDKSQLLISLVKWIERGLKSESGNEDFCCICQYETYRGKVLYLV